MDDINITSSDKIRTIIYNKKKSMKNGILKKEHLMFVTILALALGIRQLAMSLIVSFVAPYTQSLLYGTLAMGGIALGIFSLTQGIFQVPFGALCDKVGSKFVVLLGLGILIIGLILSCVSNNAYVYIISRALQGSGAITSASYAWISKTVDFEERADSISFVGAAIGLASAISLGGGPIFISFVSVRMLYVISTILVIIVFFLVLIFLKEDKDKKIVRTKKDVKGESALSYLKKLFSQKEFISYMIIAFVGNYIGLASFFIIPEYLRVTLGQNYMWEVLTPSVLISIIIMRLSTKYIKKGLIKNIVLVSAIFMVIGVILMFSRNENSFIIFFEGVFVFAAYTIFSALTPTLINSIAKNEFRGLLNGIMNGFSYIGSFLGATITGILWGSHLYIALSLVLVFSIVVVLIAIFIINNNINLKSNSR